MQIIKVNKFTTTPWINGGGMTRQIAIHPESANASLLDFDWRLSWASVNSSGDFSSFPGYQRLLVVWEGELSLNDRQLPLLTPYSFSGELKTTCQLHSENVEDLGLIYRPDKIDADMKIHYVRGTVESKFSPNSFLFCASGAVQAAGFELQRAQCLYIKKATELKMTSLKAVVIAVQLRSK